MSKVRQQPLRRIKSEIDNFNKYTQEDLIALQDLREDIKNLFLNTKSDHLGYPADNPVKVKLITARQHALKIQSRLRDLDRLREMVLPAELEIFDSLVAHVEIKAAQAILEFAEFQKKAKEELIRQESNSTHSRTAPNIFETSSSTIQLSRLLETEDTEQSVHKLTQDIQHIEEVTTNLSQIVHQQGDRVVSIEENVTEARENQIEGTKQLAWASRLKAAAFPVTGALVGCTLGGPVGFLIGLKAGAAAGVLGGMVGWAGIRRYNKAQPPYQPLAITDSSVSPDLSNTEENRKCETES